MLSPSPVQTLLNAVRRRLWRERCLAALRSCLWGSAGLMLLVAAVHLTVRAVPVTALMLGLALLWLAALAWAAGQRPALPACALWADRELGGASAFGTLLEQDPGNQVHPPALRWLEHWAATRVPQAMHQLAQRPGSARWSRALLSLGVCASLAALVLMLPGRTPAARPRPASAVLPAELALGLADSTAAEASDAARQLNDIAGALRSSAAQALSERREPGPAPQPGKTPDAQASARAQADAVPNPANASAAPASPALQAGVGVMPPAGAGAGDASGREAGSSPDTRGPLDSQEARADAGGARPRQGTMTTQSALGGRAAPREMQADMDRLASYDAASPALPGAAALTAGVAAAATPPAAVAATELSPTETSYVQAWMKKASERTR